MILIAILFLLPILMSIKIRLDKYPPTSKKRRYRMRDDKRYSFHCRGYRDFYGEEM